MALGLWCFKHKINYMSKTQQQCLFLEIMTWLLKIIDGPCCEQFHVGTIFFLPIIAQSETVHPSVDERFVFLTAQDVNINSILVSEPLSMTRCMFPSALWCRKKIVPTWNCSQQGLWIIFIYTFTTSRKRHFCRDLPNVILGCFGHHKPSAISFHYTQVKADVSTADVSKIRQLPSKRYRSTLWEEPT